MSNVSVCFAMHHHHPLVYALEKRICVLLMFVVSVVSDLDVVHRLYFTSMLACVVVGSRGIISLLHGAHPYILTTAVIFVVLSQRKRKKFLCLAVCR